MSFQSLADSSDRVWKQARRFEVQQQMVAAQGTAKALKSFMKELSTNETAEKEDDQDAFISKFGGGV